MKKISIILLLLAVSFKSFGWSFTGHDAVAYIAECHLDPQTKAILDEYLDGKSIVYYSTFLDQMRFLEEYQDTHLKYAHGIFFNNDGTPIFNEDKHPNALIQIPATVERLSGGRYRQMSKDDVAFCIKYLVHAVGDMHCPGHIHREGAKVTDAIKVVFMGERMGYHGLWDNTLITFIHPWSYMEYNHQLGNLTPSQVEEITSGSVIDWGCQMLEYTSQVYDWVYPECELGKPFIYKAYPVADRCIQLAGYRLAKILDDCFRQ